MRVVVAAGFVRPAPPAAAGGPREAVPGLVPAQRRADQLDQRQPRGQADQQEVDRHPRDRPGEIPPAAAGAADEGGQDQGGEPRPEQRDGEPRGEVVQEDGGGRDLQDQEGPRRRGEADRVGERRDHRPGNQGGGAERLQAAEPAGVGEGAPPVGQARLDQALQPAGALAEPGTEAGRRLLEGGAGQVVDRVARQREAQAEIRVLGDVVGVPAVQRPHHVGAQVRPYGANAPEYGLGQGIRHRL